MSTIDSAAAPLVRPGILNGLLRLIRATGDAIAMYWMRREALKTLRQLDDRALRDIGIARCQIDTAVTGDLNLELARIR